MQQLTLKYSHVVQGSFEVKRLNLLLVFQVNCPGCFMDAIPLLDNLSTKYQHQLGCAALSTAFEDFDKNTLDNTRLLVTTGELVGETKKALHNNFGMSKFSMPTQFPILFDEIVPGHSLWKDADLRIREAHQTTGNLANEQLTKAIKAYYHGMPQVGYTFSANLFKGTPTFVLYDDTLKILGHWFGHVGQDKISKEIEQHIVN